MRIIVATTHTIPAFSGGWTTPLDLFGEDHQAMYVIRNYPLVSRRIEGIRVEGTGAVGFLKEPWPRCERYRIGLVRKLFRRSLRNSFRSFGADFVLCLDPGAGYEAMHEGLPYAMRFHSQVLKAHEGPDFKRLMERSLFNISCPRTDVPGTEVIPHNQDLSRFVYSEPERAERVILLTSIDDIHEPELFIQGVLLSRNMKGDIVGTGPDRKRIEALCRKTGGRVRCLPPVPRLRIPELLSGYQVGAATVKQVAPVLYQMKVNAYMAAGLFTIAKPWTHIAREAPELVRTFVTPEEMAEVLDSLQEHWLETLPTRRKAREWIHGNYSVEIPRKRFNEILRERFGNASS